MCQIPYFDIMCLINSKKYKVIGFFHQQIKVKSTNTRIIYAYKKGTVESCVLTITAVISKKLKCIPNVLWEVTYIFHIKRKK